MPELPPEIIQFVLELVYASQITPDWSSFRRFSLVCKVWSWYAQALLYCHVRLETERQVLAFWEATDPTRKRGQRLGDAVRVLRISLHEDETPDSLSTNKITQNNLPKTLRHCLRLYELRITLEGVRSFSDETLMYLQHTPPIVALRITDSISDGEAARQLLYLWPSVKHLVLRSTSINTGYAEDYETALPLHLFELRWEAKDPPTTPLLLWVLGKSKESLRILHLSRLPREDWEDQLATHYSPSIFSLRLPKPDTKLIGSAVQLRELYILHDVDITSGLLKGLPHELNHLAFAINTQDGLALRTIVENQLSPSRLPSLRVVTCYKQFAGGWGNFHKLVVECQAVDIELVCLEEGILVGNTEDLLPTETFPRRKTLRSIYNIDAEADDRPHRSLGLESPIPSIPHSRASSDVSRGASPERHPMPFQLHQVAWDDENNRPLEPIKLDSPTHGSRHLFKALRKPFKRKKEEVKSARWTPPQIVVEPPQETKRQSRRRERRKERIVQIELDLAK